MNFEPISLNLYSSTRHSHHQLELVKDGRVIVRNNILEVVTIENRKIIKSKQYAFIMLTDLFILAKPVTDKTGVLQCQHVVFIHPYIYCFPALN